MVHSKSPSVFDYSRWIAPAGKQRFTAADKVGEKLNKQVLLDFQHFAGLSYFREQCFAVSGN